MRYKIKSVAISVSVVLLIFCAIFASGCSGALPETYDIIYELDGGTNHPDNPAQYKKGQSVTLKEPSLDDAEFLGWYSEAGVKVTSVSGSGDVTIYAEWNRINLLYGIGEPLTNSQVKGFHLETSAALMDALGARSYRSWIEPAIIDAVMDGTKSVDGLSINNRQITVYKNINEKLYEAGIRHIVGHGNIFPKVPSTNMYTGDIAVAPYPTAPDYLLFMQKVERIWFLIAGAFKEITVWEVGNETNHNPFLHPGGYVANGSKDQHPLMNANETAFTMEQKAQITTDLMFYAAKGIKAANPDAIVIVPGLAPVGGFNSSAGNAMKIFLEQIYDNIKSGGYPTVLSEGYERSENPDDYFEGVAWHPYLGAYNEKWIELNNDIYEVMQNNGDGHKKVWFTEMGVTNGTGSSESDQNEAGYLKQYFDAVKSNMPYVKAFMVFRLYECQYAASWGGTGEIYYGLFKEPTDTKGFSPKAKAYAVQEIFGGTGDLKMYE